MLAGRTWNAWKKILMPAWLMRPSKVHNTTPGVSYLINSKCLWWLHTYVKLIYDILTTLICYRLKYLGLYIKPQQRVSNTWKGLITFRWVTHVSCPRDKTYSGCINVPDSVMKWKRHTSDSGVTSRYLNRSHPPIDRYQNLTLLHYCQFCQLFLRY